jgi:hypothetical protein
MSPADAAAIETGVFSLRRVTGSSAAAVTAPSAGEGDGSGSPHRSTLLNSDQVEELFCFTAAQVFGASMATPEGVERFSMVSLDVLVPRRTTFRASCT